MLKGECLPAAVVGQHAQLRGCTIIADTCYGGTDEMAEAVLSRGARAYIGCTQEIGSALNVFMVNFFYRVIDKKMSDEDACKEAIEATGSEAETLRYFSSAKNNFGHGCNL